ncbi:hypothetical protein K8U54_19250 [Pseudomonas fulva]|uniref:hypothetical protein n=1 Tax=Pseudomonas fulva TaxID=47880 RepID=UPI00201DE7C0|nr:hypothetical protein [Pseudomonas fulva]UQY33828.1 hypothetical protein K8U54_19250 [Pseudomonas fulva]
MQPACLDLPVTKGATLRKPLLLMQPTYTYRPITAIAQSAPLRLTVPEHGLPGDWPTWIEGSNWSALNRDKGREGFRIAKRVDADTLDYNDLNGLGQRAQGGTLVYQLPVDLAGCRAVLLITPDAGQPIELTTENGGLAIAGLGRLLLEMTAAQTAAIDWAEARYNLDITFTDGSVQRWLQGKVTVNGGCCHG